MKYNEVEFLEVVNVRNIGKIQSNQLKSVIERADDYDCSNDEKSKLIIQKSFETKEQKVYLGFYDYCNKIGIKAF